MFKENRKLKNGVFRFVGLRWENLLENTFFFFAIACNAYYNGTEILAITTNNNNEYDKYFRFEDTF